MRKKILAILTIATLVMSMTACGGEVTATKKEDAGKTSVSTNEEISKTDSITKSESDVDVDVSEIIEELPTDVIDENSEVIEEDTNVESDTEESDTVTVVVDGEEITLEVTDPVEVNVTGLTKVEYKGTTYTLGVTTFKEFLNTTGLIVNDVVLGDISGGYTVEPFDSFQVDLDFSKDDLNTHTCVMLCNNSENTVDIMDCQLMGIDNSNELYLEDGLEGPTMSSAGIKIGDKLSDIKGLLGEPQETSGTSFWNSYLWDIITPEGKFWVIVHTTFDTEEIIAMNVELR